MRKRPGETPDSSPAFQRRVGRQDDFRATRHEVAGYYRRSLRDINPRPGGWAT